MPSVPATIIASSASSIVAGRVEPIRPATPRRKWIEVPKSPCSTWPAQIRYWRNSGWSSPISWRFASISASVAFGGSDIAAGSTGSRRRMQNSSAETMNRMTTETRMRRAMRGRMEVMRPARHPPLIPRARRDIQDAASLALTQACSRARWTRSSLAGTSGSIAITTTPSCCPGSSRWRTSRNSDSSCAPP